MSSSDDEFSVLQFCRSVKLRKHRARNRTSGSDEENTPPSAVGQQTRSLEKQGRLFSARSGLVKQLHAAEVPMTHQLVVPEGVAQSPAVAPAVDRRHITHAQPAEVRHEWFSPSSNATASPGHSDHQWTRTAAGPHINSSSILSAAGSTADTPPASPAVAAEIMYSHSVAHGAACGAAADGAAVEGAESPCIPGTPQAATALDIHDPFTPWLRTAHKQSRKQESGSKSCSRQDVDTSSPSSMSSSMCSWQQGDDVDEVDHAVTSAAAPVSEQDNLWTEAAAQSISQATASTVCASTPGAAAEVGPLVAVQPFSSVSPATGLRHSLPTDEGYNHHSIGEVLQHGGHASISSSTPTSPGRHSGATPNHGSPAGPFSSLVCNSVDSKQQLAADDSGCGASPSSYCSPNSTSSIRQYHDLRATAEMDQHSSSLLTERQQHWQQQAPDVWQHLEPVQQTASSQAAVTPSTQHEGRLCGQEAVRSSADLAEKESAIACRAPPALQESASTPSAAAFVCSTASIVEQLMSSIIGSLAADPVVGNQPSSPAAPAAAGLPRSSSSSSDEDDRQITFSRRKPRRPASSKAPLQPAAHDSSSNSSSSSSGSKVGGMQPNTWTMSGNKVSIAAAGSQRPESPNSQYTGSSSDSSDGEDSDDQDLQLIFGRRKPLRPAEQLVHSSEEGPSTNSSSSGSSGADDSGSGDGSDGDTSDWATGSCSDSDSSGSGFSFSAPRGNNSIRGPSGHITPHQSAAGIAAVEHPGRITPGSSSSLVARRRKRQEGQHDITGFKPTPQQRPLLQQQQMSSWWQQPIEKQHRQRSTPPSSAANDPYDFDEMMSALTPPNTIRGCLNTPGGFRNSSAFGATPCAMLSFTPAAAAAAAAPWTSAHPGDKAGATAAAAGGLRRYSFGLSPISPPVLKPRASFGIPAAAAAGASPCIPTASSNRTDDLAGPGSHTVNLNAVAAGVTTAAAPGAISGKGAGAPGRGRKQQQAGSMTAPAKAPSSRMFAKQRQQLAQELYDQWNKQVFDGGLPPHLPVVWNPRLTSTAGQVVDDGSQNRLKTSREERIPVRLELSSKVLDTEARLRTTLGHEMCHVAAWAISREFKQHHGPAFWAWASRFEQRVPGIKITTCHNYEIHAPFRWQCMNPECGKQYHRHKRSIDPNKHVCSRCSGRLMFLGKFSRDGKLLGGIAGSATPGTASKTPGGGGNVFSQFVKTHFATIKKGLPAGTPHKEIMSRLATQYKQQKIAAADLQQEQQQCDLQRQQTPAVPGLEGKNNTMEQRTTSIQLLSDSDTSGDDEQQHQQVDVEADDDSLLTFMQRLDLAG